MLATEAHSLLILTILTSYLGEPPPPGNAFIETILGDNMRIEFHEECVSGLVFALNLEAPPPVGMPIDLEMQNCPTTEHRKYLVTRVKMAARIDWRWGSNFAYYEVFVIRIDLNK